MTRGPSDAHAATPGDVDLLVLGGGMAGLSAAAWSVGQGRSVVLVEKGPIPGLHAAGADAGGLYARAYAGGIAAALTFGLRAARAALETATAASGRIHA